jgi:peroxiredoxin
MNSISPGSKAPQLSFSTVDGQHWDLHVQKPRALTLVSFYRGLFCPYCKAFVTALNALTDEFRTRGIEPVAVSVDSLQSATAAVSEWQLSSFPVGYGLQISVARQWGLFVSEMARDAIVLQFSEPGLFLVRPDATVYAMMINSVPCGRPDLPSLLKGLDFLAQQGFPIRGAA